MWRSTLIQLPLLALALAIACSCNENNPKAGKDASLAVDSSATADSRPALASQSQPQGNVTEITPPNDARWTIYCHAVGGPTHVEQANAIKAELVRTTGLKNWYVIHENEQSVLYYGFYRSIEAGADPKEAARAKADRKRLDEIRDPQGNPVFASMYFVALEPPDPPAPAEWNLANADGYWSLQIAAYKDSPKRKEMAVETVREARKQGIPAYFYHGETTSSVCVGVWPRTAVKEQAEETAQASDPSQDLLVFDQPLPAGSASQFRNREGEAMRAMAPKVEPADPSLAKAIESYPYHAVNGEIPKTVMKDPITNQSSEVMDHSFLVVIPQKKSGLLSNMAAPAGEHDSFNAAAWTQPAAPPAPGMGRLRSLNDQR